MSRTRGKNWSKTFLSVYSEFLFYSYQNIYEHMVGYSTMISYGMATKKVHEITYTILASKKIKRK